VTPGDRGADRLLPRGQIARPTDEQGQRAVEPGQHRGRREDLDAGGGELDRERQAVQPAADLGDRRGVVAVDREVRLDPPCPLDEERHGWGAKERRIVPGRLRIGE
jgi:hypothetical protein